MSLNLMTYDYHTGSGIAHFNAPLYPAPTDPTPTLNIDSMIRAYLSLGSPPEKLVLGIPFFGYKYGDVASHDDGLFQHAGGGEYVLFRDLEAETGCGYRWLWQSDFK